MPYDLLEDEEELDPALEMEGGRPNVPRNPDAETDPRQKIKDYLDRQGMMRADPEMRKMDRASLDELRGSDRDIAFQNLLQKSAAQMGTIGGKAAPTGAFDEFSKNLMAQNAGARGDIMGQRKDAAAEDDRQIKIRQYMADKMMDDKQKAASLAERQASRTSTEDYRNKTLALREKEIGAKAGKEKEPSESERKFGAFANRAQSANDAYESYIAQNPKAGQMGAKDMLIGKYAGDMAGGLMSDEAKMSQQLEKEFIGSVLRPETGAAASDDEWAMYGKKYFPRAGDTPEILARKTSVRKQDIDTMRTIAGRGASPMPQTQMAGAPKASPPIAEKPTAPVTGAVGAGQTDYNTLPDDELDRLYREAGGT